MNRDTYARFLRSEAYKELLLGGKKKVSNESNKQERFYFIFILQKNKPSDIHYTLLYHIFFSTFFLGKHV